MADVKFTSHADEVLEAFAKATANALTAIGMTAETYAKRETPVDTGRLRNSITNAVDADDSAVYIGSNVEYAPYIELGTRSSKAHNMLRRAATEHSAEYKALAKAAYEHAGT